MGVARRIINRIYADYLMPSRINEYRSILTNALEQGYLFITMNEFQKLVRTGALLKDQKYFINRHDIDTGLNFTHEFFAVEKELGIKSTYYFRLSTLDFDLMKEIEAFGSEASYHFEELATYAKKQRIKSKDDILKSLPQIRDEFRDNYLLIQKATGNALKTLASHGDFANRILGLTNSIVIDDQIKTALGIDAEVYETDLIGQCEMYISDDDYPALFKPMHPDQALKNDPKVIQMLTHPRHWKRDLISNTKENITRIKEGLLYGA